MTIKLSSYIQLKENSMSGDMDSISYFFATRPSIVGMTSAR